MVTNINKGQVVDRTKELIAGSEQIMTGGLENRIGNVETNATRHVGV